MKHTLLKPRLIAVVAAVATLTTLSNGVSAQAASLPNTDAFLRASFSNGQFVAGFTPGKPDFGFSLEALLQRKALGEASSSLAPAVNYLLTDSANSGTPENTSGFLFSGGKIKLGLAGKWAFASAIIGAKNTSNRKQIVSLALSKIDGSGDVAPDAVANTYDRAWLVLALAANDRPRQAALLATNMAKHELADGGFNDGFTLGTGSADGTGISLQALAVGRKLASKSQLAIINSAIAKAIAFLDTSATGDHYSSYGDYDLNGTAYAAMGLSAVGRGNSLIRTWLNSKVATDGGLQTPWSGGAGDIYATAQGALALLGKSYAGLLAASPSQKGAVG